MIYSINNKYYLKVQGYFKPIDVSFVDDEPVIKVNDGEKLEVNNVKEYKIVTLNDIKANQHKEVTYKRK